jgi:prevent-host-death family protein
MKPAFVSLTRAKVELEQLIKRAQKGELILISRYGEPKAWIEPLGPEYKQIRIRLRRAVSASRELRTRR